MSNSIGCRFARKSSASPKAGADNFAIGEHVIVFVLPLAARNARTSAFSWVISEAAAEH
jgi:hypothetical protein